MDAIDTKTFRMVEAYVQSVAPKRKKARAKRASESGGADTPSGRKTKRART